VIAASNQNFFPTPSLQVRPSGSRRPTGEIIAAPMSQSPAAVRHSQEGRTADTRRRSALNRWWEKNCDDAPPFHLAASIPN
jgi:hypothetical protein